jgi:DNA-binding CsgD family transcriptional regulator
MFKPSEIRAIDTAVLDTITDIGKWGDVIRLLIKTSGATKGILALRQSRSASFVVPSQILDSPLIVGFSMTEIERYVTDFVASDPWTEIEKKYHPTRPYALSKYLPFEDLKKAVFWEWLKPQDISDTVVVSVGSFEAYWVGLNLFFDGQDNMVQQRTIALLDEMLPNLKRAWSVSEVHRMASQQSGVTLREIAFLPLSAFFCKANGETNMATDQLRALQVSEPDLLRGIEPYVQFELRHHHRQYTQLLEQVAKDGITASTHLDHGDVEMVLSISRVTQAEDVLGRKTAQFLCVLTHPSFDEKTRINALIGSGKLSPREEELLNYLKEPGSTIVGFSNHIGKSKHAADFHWRNLKRKLGVNNLQDLRRLTIIEDKT